MPIARARLLTTIVVADDDAEDKLYIILVQTRDVSYVCRGTMSVDLETSSPVFHVFMAKDTDVTVVKLDPSRPCVRFG